MNDKGQALRVGDAALLEQVRRAASLILERDPDLASSDHARLAEALRRSEPDGIEVH